MNNETNLLLINIIDAVKQSDIDSETFIEDIISDEYRDTARMIDNELDALDSSASHSAEVLKAWVSDARPIAHCSDAYLADINDNEELGRHYVDEELGWSDNRFVEFDYEETGSNLIFSGNYIVLGDFYFDLER